MKGQGVPSATPRGHGVSRSRRGDPASGPGWFARATLDSGASGTRPNLEQVTRTAASSLASPIPILQSRIPLHYTNPHAPPGDEMATLAHTPRKLTGQGVVGERRRGSLRHPLPPRPQVAAWAGAQCCSRLQNSHPQAQSEVPGQAGRPRGARGTP